MVLINLAIVASLLAPLSFAAKSCPTRPADGDRLTCTVDGKLVFFSNAAAAQLAKVAPSGEGLKTATNYPHEFQNFGGEITWDNQACNSDSVRTLEFPIAPDGSMYPWNVKPKADPGDCRVVYSMTDGHYCGVMCHRTGGKGFNKCPLS
ncbi:uncharacterized protein PFLUO_LOCUS4688 [Penicillium psychrofluorescens]|uniref:uncharacterized protein n=1 Tax=Penicillium psychrofluorescens TaxID=3158075 RepID=UPI003CCD19A2